MNKRVLFLVGVLSLSLLTWSFAALGASDSSTASVSVTISDYVNITNVKAMSFNIDDPTSGPFYATDSDAGTPASFDVETNQGTTNVSFSWTGPSDMTVDMDLDGTSYGNPGDMSAEISSRGTHSYTVNGKLSGVGLDDAPNSSYSGTLTINVS